jgi:ABC-type branched-subunit amino acid transport system substrate-binding protein
MKKRLLKFFTLLSLLFIVFHAKNVSADEKSPYRIGVCYALTGAAAKWSEAHLRGVELAKDTLPNHGSDIELMIDDTGTSTSGSVTCLQRMIQQKKAEVVIGNVWGFLTNPLIPIVEREKVPLISTGIFRSGCPANSKYFFSISEQIEDNQPLFEQFFQSNPEIKTVGILYFDDGEWGEQNKTMVTQAAKKLNRKIVATIGNLDFQAEFRTLFPKIITKKPDAIFVFHEPLASTRALRDLGYQGIIVQSNAIGEQVRDDGSYPELFEKVYFADIPQSKDFQKKFRKKFSRSTALEPHSGYDALMVAYQALQKNRSDPAKAIRENVFSTLYQIADFGHSCAGKLKSSFHFFQIQNGYPIEISPTSS